MDMVERRVREVFAALLSQGARVLERTAGEFEHAADELRGSRPTQPQQEDAWRDDDVDGDPEPIVRSTPLHAVPDTPTDETPVEPPTASPAIPSPADSSRVPPPVPPREPPRMPDRDRPGRIDATPAASPTVTSPTETLPNDPSVVAPPASPPAAAVEPDDADAAVGSPAMRDLASGTVAAARARLDDLSDDDLRALREAELAGRNRTTLLTAIEQALDGSD